MKAHTLFIIALAMGACAPAYAKERPTYVGEGRYACADGAKNCAAVDRHNSRVTADQRARNESRNERVDAYVEKSRSNREKFKAAVEGKRPR